MPLGFYLYDKDSRELTNLDLHNRQNQHREQYLGSDVLLLRVSLG